MCTVILVCSIVLRRAFDTLVPPLRFAFLMPCLVVSGYVLQRDDLYPLERFAAAGEHAKKANDSDNMTSVFVADFNSARI